MNTVGIDVSKGKCINRREFAICTDFFPPSRRSFSAILSGFLATQTIFLNNESCTSKNAVTTFKEVHRNDGLQENS